MSKSNITERDFTRINNNVNGNPRYVLHFVALAAEGELDLSDRYERAVSRAKPFGGKKYHCRAYGGGIAFSTYDLHELCDQLNAMMDSLTT